MTFLLSMSLSCQSREELALKYYREGRERLEQGQFPKAKEAFKKAIIYCPEMAEAHHGWAKSLLETGWFTVAENEMKLTIDLMKKFPPLDSSNLPENKRLSQAYRDLGIIYMNKALLSTLTQRYNSARLYYNRASKAFKEALVLEPEDKETIKWLKRSQEALLWPFGLRGTP